MRPKSEEDRSSLEKNPRLENTWEGGMGMGMENKAALRTCVPPGRGKVKGHGLGRGWGLGWGLGRGLGEGLGEGEWEGVGSAHLHRSPRLMQQGLEPNQALGGLCSPRLNQQSTHHGPKVRDATGKSRHLCLLHLHLLQVTTATQTRVHNVKHTPTYDTWWASPRLPPLHNIHTATNNHNIGSPSRTAHTPAPTRRLR